jgi:alpha-ketoglutarate-dependent taurine dioxygenase
VSGVRELAFDAAGLKVTWDDGLRRDFAAAWLRDNIAAARQGPHGQKQADIRDLPEPVALIQATLRDDGLIAVRFEDLDAVELYAPQWLRAPAGAVDLPSARPWDASLADGLPTESWSAIDAHDHTLARWLDQVVRYGFALARGVPTRPGSVFDVVARFGYVRETNYGRLFDVVSRDAPANLAYSPAALSLHTDNPYRDPVPTLQLLHCLTAGHAGGETVLADGIRVAEAFRKQHPEDFAQLANTPVRFRYVDKDVDLQCVAPMIQCDLDGAVRSLRYNQRSLAPLELPADRIAPFYRAYRRFSHALHREEALVSFTLTPGDLVILDNRRVLHGRRGTVEGHRHLQGCYADIDGLHSRLRRLRAAEHP